MGHQAADHNGGNTDRRHGEQPPDRELGILHAPVNVVAHQGVKNVVQRDKK